MSFGKARTTAGARLCSPPITIGIFPAPTISEAILVTPPTISVVGPKAGVSPRSATGTSSRSLWWSIMKVSKLYEASRIARGANREPPRKEQVRSYGTPNKAMRAASYFATASAKRGPAIREPEPRGLILGRARSLPGQLAAAQGFHVHDFLAGLELALQFLWHRKFERLVGREVHELRDVPVHRKDLGLPLVDHRNTDLVGDGMDDRSLLTVEEADHFESGFRFAVFPWLRHLDADDPARFVVDDHVPVHLELPDLRLFPRHRDSPAAIMPGP